MTSKDSLCAKLLEIIAHTEEAKTNLKCDVCNINAVVALCTDCTLCLCKVCYKHRNSEHDIILLDKASFCQEHKEIFEYYCEKCDKFVCSIPGCKAKHSFEDNHCLDTIEKMVLKHRNRLTELAAIIDRIGGTLSQTEVKVINLKKKLEEQLAEVEQRIGREYEVQIEKKKERRHELEKELSDIASQKNNSLLTHLEEIRSTQNEVNRVKKLFDDLKTLSDQEVIGTKKHMIEFYVQKVNSQFKDLMAKHTESGLIVFSPVTESTEVLGKLYVDANFSKIRKSELTSPTGAAEEASDNDDDSCQISVKSDEVEGISLIPCKDVPTKIVNCDGKMGNPWGVAVAQTDTGLWAVADNTKHCIYIFNSQNELLCKFGQEGKGDGEFIRPFGLAFDSNDHLYVVDGQIHRVQKFDTNGKLLCQFGKEGNGRGDLKVPYGVTTHNDRVYVTDFYNKRISVFQIDGQFSFSFGSDFLAGPQDVAINADKELLFVTDNCNHKVCVFTVDGHFVYQFGQQGHCEGKLNLPLDVAIWNGKILVSDENHRLSIFSEDGKFLSCISSCGDAEGKLNYPYGIACKSDSVYVADYVNQRVQIFNLHKFNL